MKNKYDFIIIFSLSCIFYGLIGGWFSLYTLLPLHPKYIHDLYLGFDNTFQNTSFVRHPLLKILSILLNKLSIFIPNPEFLLVGICIFLLSVQNIFIYYYLVRIIQITKRNAILILLIFLGFSSNLILSFTFESYTFSTCFISIFLYYHAKFQKKNKILPFHWFSAFFILIGGITITNGIKVLLVSFYKTPKVLLKYSTIISICFGIVCIALYPLIYASISHSSQFLVSGEQYISDIFYLFLGGSVVFPNIEIHNLPYENKESIIGLIATYPNFISIKSFIIFNVLILLLTSAIIYFRNKLVFSLLLFFSIDIFIHCILKFGLNESQIFGGNFIAIYPLLMGYLLKNQSRNHIFFLYLFILGVAIYFCNFQDLYKIADFAKTFYPKN